MAKSSLRRKKKADFILQLLGHNVSVRKPEKTETEALEECSLVACSSRVAQLCLFK